MSTSGIDYKLGLELKNAGFPNIRYGYDIKIPTLSELIEACGEEFGRLILQNYEGLPDDRKWWANYGEFHGYGKTPKKAVAKLWLELNK